MAIQSDNRGSGLNRLVSQLGADKKKAVIAVGLVLLMVFMWVRLIGGKGAKSARAAVTPVTDTDLNSTAQSKVVFVELPYVGGRHDVLARDFFRLDGQAFSASEEVSIVSDNSTEQGVREVAKRLRLEAISTGAQPEAFINDKLLKVGDVLVLDGGSRSYECEIVSIKANVVLVKYEEAEIELKLKQPNEAAQRFED
jgi:hypothetical protein